MAHDHVGSGPAQDLSAPADPALGTPGEPGEHDTGAAPPGDAADAGTGEPRTSAEAELSRLADEIASLHALLERHDPAGHFSSSLRQLTDELAQARRQELRPLYLDMILLLDRVENGLSAWRDAPAVEEFVATVRDEIAEILARRGVTPVTAPDAWFDPKLQRAVKAIPTQNPEEDRRVVEIVRRGYECDGYILRPEEVIVSRYSADVIEG